MKYIVIVGRATKIPFVMANSKTAKEILNSGLYSKVFTGDLTSCNLFKTSIDIQNRLTKEI